MITLTMPDSESPRANQAFSVGFDYSKAGKYGVVLPLEIIVQPCFGPGGVGSGYRRVVFRRIVPDSYMLKLPSAGLYLIVLREMFHNQWFGRLEVEAAGDIVTHVQLVRR
jgi:hypothetical protein